MTSKEEKRLEYALSKEERPFGQIILYSLVGVLPILISVIIVLDFVLHGEKSRQVVIPQMPNYIVKAIPFFFFIYLY